MNRNVAKDVEKGIEYRKYYLEKMKNIIGSFSENQQKFMLRNTQKWLKGI